MRWGCPGARMMPPEGAVKEALIAERGELSGCLAVDGWHGEEAVVTETQTVAGSDASPR